MPRALELAQMIAAEPAAAIEGLKRLTAIALAGDLAAGSTRSATVLGGLYRSEIGQARVQEFAEKSAARAAEKAAEGMNPEDATIIAGSVGRMAR